MLKLRYLLFSSLILLVLFNSQCLPPPADQVKPSKKSHPATPQLKRVNHPDQLKFHPLNITIPKPQRRVFNNGLIIYLLENHELPLVEVIVRIRTGSIYDPADKLGLSNLTATLMRTGGTGKLTAEEFDEELESIGATLEMEVDYENISFSLSVLSQDLERGLRLLADIVRQPVFAEEKLLFEKSQLAEVFRRENDQPSRIAMRELRKLVYPIHPYGNRIIGNPDTVKSITREDIVSFYNRYINPNNSFFGIAGDFRDAQALELIKQIFGDWAQNRTAHPELPKLEQKYKKSINLVSKKINQASIMLGHIGIKRTSPDYFPLMLMNAILGGSSVSRLNHKIRVKYGLAYGISSWFIMPQDLGVFVIQTSTKNKSVGKALNLILEELKKIRKEPVRDEELRHTKDAIISSFVFRFDTPRRIVDQAIWIEYLGLPKDYLETYRDKIMQVTKKDILRVARKYLHPDELIFVVVGNDEKFDMPLTEFGPVNIIKLPEKP